MPNPFSPHDSNGPLYVDISSSEMHITYQNIRRQNAVLLSILAAGGAGYWLLKSRSLQRDQKRQEQIYIKQGEHIDTTKVDH